MVHVVVWKRGSQWSSPPPSVLSQEVLARLGQAGAMELESRQ